jgi:hypothetical protein
VWIISVSVPLGYLFVFSPLLVSFIMYSQSRLRNVHRGEPSYQHYIESTPRFFPDLKRMFADLRCALTNRRSTQEVAYSPLRPSGSDDELYYRSAAASQSLFASPPLNSEAQPTERSARSQRALLRRSAPHWDFSEDPTQ